MSLRSRAGYLFALLLAAAAAWPSPVVASNYPYPTRRPHLGAQSWEQGTIYWNDNAGHQYWAIWRWPTSVCGYSVGFYVDPSIPSSLRAAAASEVVSWNNPFYCGPWFTQVSSSSAAKVRIIWVTTSLCGYAPGSGWIAVACRTTANSETDQAWTIGFNSARAFGVGVSGRFDVQSITAIETGHVIYGDHNPNWDDSIQQLNSCTWGSTSCTVTNDTYAGFSNYVATCTNCGDRRTQAAGDWDFVRHLYGKSCTTPPCPSAVQKVVPDPPSPEASAAQERATQLGAAWGNVFVDVLTGQ